MILVAIWSAPNAVAAWVMRSGYITGTPAQVRHWTITAFLALGFFAAWIAMLAWLNRVAWYQRTGDLVPMPIQKLTARQQLSQVARMIPWFGWFLAAIFLERWLTPKIWPIQRNSTQLLFLIMMAPLLPTLAMRVAKNPALRDRVRQEWRAASWSERASRLALAAWTLGFLISIEMGGPSLVGWGLVLWFPIPPAILIGIAGQLVLLTAMTLSIRRR